jgi:hypothetical protein
MHCKGSALAHSKVYTKLVVIREFKCLSEIVVEMNCKIMGKIDYKSASSKCA